MVKIAVAGGSGHIASEVIDVIAATKNHEILILSRKEPGSVIEDRPGVSWKKADYTDKTSLIGLLKGVHTVLCFSGAHLDHGSVAQKALIDACVAAGVQRYAPNEWSGSSIEELPWYAEKANVRAYMEDINKEKKVLEYTLFQPGLLLDFLAPKGSAHLKPQELFIDFIKRRAMVLKDKECIVTLTSVNDLAHVVARAVEYKGEWPVVGGVQGTTLSLSKVLAIGAKVQGDKPWDITYVAEAEVRSDDFNPPWVPFFQDDYLTQEQIEAFSKVILKGSILSSACGSWVVSDDWNRLLPDYNFTGAEEFLEKVWIGKA